MKKLFFTVLIAVAAAASAFAGPGSANILVLNSFKNAFGNASDVKWSAAGEYAKASFINNNVRTEAFYNSAGDLIGTSRGISMDELPVKAKRSFAKRFDGYTVKEAIRFDATDESAYFISAENDNESVIVKVGENEQASIYRTTKK